MSLGPLLNDPEALKFKRCLRTLATWDRVIEVTGKKCLGKKLDTDCVLPHNLRGNKSELTLWKQGKINLCNGDKILGVECRNLLTLGAQIQG